MIQNSVFLFLYHTLWVVVLNMLFVGWGFFFFLPFLLQKIHLSPPQTCIRIAFCCGFLLDICSGASYLGLSALSYALLIPLLLQIQPYLIEEKISSFCLLSGSATIFLLFLFPFLSHLVGSPVIGGAFSIEVGLDLIWINILYTLVSLGPFWWKKTRPHLKC